MSNFIRNACLALMLSAGVIASVAAEQRPRLAIIIDDLGYKQVLGRRAIDLPGPVAVAVLPGTPRGATLATHAYESGKEVLLHLPLQSVASDSKSEPGAISLDMTREQFASIFASSFESVPFAIGVNTHQGSLLTRHPGHMAWLMDEISHRDSLFFVDSFTTSESVALMLARESRIPAIRRDVFLDFEDNEEAVLRELERLKGIARRKGSAVAIGHPYESTMAVLEREIPKLASQGLDLVSIGELIALNSAVELEPQVQVKIDAVF